MTLSRPGFPLAWRGATPTGRVAKSRTYGMRDFAMLATTRVYGIWRVSYE